MTVADVAGEDWYGHELNADEYARVGFRNVDMTEVVNQGSTFTECTFRGVRFNASRHTVAAFLNCTFAECVFFDAQFEGCKLVGSQFVRCSFDLLKVDGGDWSFVGLAGADLRRAGFVDVRMREADLSKARCEGGSLVRVDLSGAALHGIDLRGCDLRGSDLSALDPQAATLRGAIITWEQSAVIASALGLDVRPTEHDQTVAAASVSAGARANRRERVRPVPESAARSDDASGRPASARHTSVRCGSRSTSPLRVRSSG